MKILSAVSVENHVNEAMLYDYGPRNFRTNILITVQLHSDCILLRPFVVELLHIASCNEFNMGYKRRLSNTSTAESAKKMLGIQTVATHEWKYTTMSLLLV
jgi:hypothetical protein